MFWSANIMMLFILIYIGYLYLRHSLSIKYIFKVFFKHFNLLIKTTR